MRMQKKLTPRHHQRALLDFHSNNGCLGTLTWHGMGLGKTLSALWAAQKHIQRLQSGGVKAPKILILCPKSAQVTWRDEIKNSLPELWKHTHIYAISSIHHTIKRLKYLDVRFLIIDESHALKSPETDRAKVMSRLLEELGTRTQRFHEGRIMLLTGTPMPNGAHELYTSWAMCTAPHVKEAAARLIDPDRYKQWTTSFAGSKRKTWYKGKGKKRTGKTPEGTNSAQVENLCRLLGQFTHYRRVTDCIDIPPAHEHHVKLNLPDDKLLEDADIERPEAYMALVERLSRAKTPHMLGWIQEFTRINPGLQLLVFAMHRAPLDEIVRYFGATRARLITGKESRKERDQNIHDFKQGQFPILGMTFKCGSESLNLQNAFCSLYHGYPWTDSTLRQAMARTYRSGQQRETQHYFLTSGENDSKVLNLVRAKQEATTAVEDGLLALEKQRIDRAILTEAARQDLYANIL